MIFFYELFSSAKISVHLEASPKNKLTGPKRSSTHNVIRLSFRVGGHEQVCLFCFFCLHSALHRNEREILTKTYIFYHILLYIYYGFSRIIHQIKFLLKAVFLRQPQQIIVIKVKGCELCFTKKF